MPYNARFTVAALVRGERWVPQLPPGKLLSTLLMPSQGMVTKSSKEFKVFTAPSTHSTLASLLMYRQVTCGKKKMPLGPRVVIDNVSLQSGGCIHHWDKAVGFHWLEKTLHFREFNH